jgi:hypothetical protein
VVLLGFGSKMGFCPVPNVQRSGKKSILSLLGLMTCFSSGLGVMIGFFKDFEGVESQEDFTEEPYNTSE